MDNLNTHRAQSLIDRFGDREGRRLWTRFTVHYTPKHGSWLNPAELEASAPIATKIHSDLALISHWGG